MYMGVIVSVDAGQLSVLLSKCLEILDLCHPYRTLSQISKRQLQAGQSALGQSALGQSALPSPLHHSNVL